MRIIVDDEYLFQLSYTQKQVIANDINEDYLEADLKRRLEYSLVNKYEQCFKRLKKQWDAKLLNDFGTFPTDPDAYAELVFLQPDYRSRKMRDQAPEED